MTNSSFTLRRLAVVVVLAVAGIGSLLMLWGQQRAGAQTTAPITFLRLVYSNTLALVQFQMDRSIAPVNSLNGPCGPVEAFLLDETGALLAQLGGTSPGSAFMSCVTDEQGVSHYTLIFLGDFHARPPHQIQIRLPSSSEPATRLSRTGFERATWKAMVGISRQGVSFEDALRTSDIILLRFCAQIPSVEDWHPRGELILEGEVWEIVASGIPNFRKPGVLGATQRCYIALLEQSSRPAQASNPSSGVRLHLRWERSLPECFSTQVYRRDIEPFLKQRGLSPEQAGLTPQQDVWCLGMQLHPELRAFLQEKWRLGPAYTLHLMP